MYTTVKGEPFDGKIISEYENILVVEDEKGERKVCRKPRGKAKRKRTHNQVAVKSIEADGTERVFPSMSLCAEFYRLSTSTVAYISKAGYGVIRGVSYHFERVKA